MGKLLISFVFLIVGLQAISAQSAKSDSLFAEGVRLYKAGNYKEAIPFFKESSNLDHQFLDSANIRRVYSAMWLASCYYKEGDMQLAKETDSLYYNLEPIDRRLTLESDLMRIKAFMAKEKDISLLESCALLEQKKLGKTNYWYGNTLCDLMVAYYAAGKYKETYEIIEKLSPIAYANEGWAKEHIMSILYTCYMLLYDYPSVKSTLIELMYSLSKTTYNTTYNSECDGFYGEALRKILEIYLDNQQLEKAIQECESARALFKSPIPIYNKNRIIILNTLGTLYAKGSLDSSGPKNPHLSHEFTSQRWPVYEEVEDVIEHTIGKYSYDWSELQIKKSNFFVYDYEHLDIVNAKSYLHRAFDCYNERSRTGEECKVYLSLLSQQSSLFSSLEDDQSFINYAYTILGEDTTICHYYGNIWKDIAERYFHTMPDKAIDIYKRLYEESVSNNDSNGAISDLMDKAFAEYLGGQNNDAVKSYIELNKLIDKFLVGKENYSPSDHARIYNYLAECYNKDRLNDSLLYNKYNGIAIEKIKYALKTNNNGFSSYSLFSIIEDLKILGEWTEKLHDGLSIDKLPEAIGYYKMAVDSLLQFQNEPNFVSILGEELGMIYNRIAQRYIYLHDFNNAIGYLDNVVTLCPDTLGYNYINAMQWYGYLYNEVSIEPELSLSYYYRNVNLTEERLKKRINEILPRERTVAIEQLIRNWQKCSKRYEKLGYNEEALMCLDRALELLKESDSEYYIQEQLWRKQKELELYSTKGVNWQSRGDYVYWTRNEIGDNERCKKVADEMNNIYLSMNKMSAEDCTLMFNLYRNYTEDSLSAKKYLLKAIEAAKKEDPLDYKYSEEYIYCQREIAKQKGKKEEINYNMSLLSLLYNKTEMRKEYVQTLGNIASLYYDIHDIDSCMVYYKKYIPSARDLGGVILQDAIEQFVERMGNDKKYKEIVPYYEDYTNYVRNDILKIFKYLTAEERESLWQNYEILPFSCGEMLNYSYNANVPTSILYDNILFRKGILLNSSISSVNLIRTQGDSLLLRKYERMLQLKKSLNSGDSKISTNGRTLTRNQAQKLVTRFEEEMMERAAMLGDYTSRLTCTWSDVQSVLKANDIAVEFTLFPTQEKKQMYGALILKAKGSPIFLPLFDSDSLKTIITTEYSSSTLYRLLWKPIMQNIDKAENIYFSPDGFLHNLAIESVPWEETASAKPKLTRVSSTRVLTTKKTKQIDNNAVVYGGIQYDVNPDFLIAESRKYDSNYRSFDIFDYSISDSLNLRSGVAYLPATKIEVENIDVTLKKKDISTTLLSDTLATEGAFKNLSGRNTNLLHIATHGFYWSEKEAKFMSNLKFLQSDLERQGQKEDKALSRSGLLLAGANNVLKRKHIPEGVDDGILTAKEISQLDLRGLDLVVLSACQTGLGEITGDGVFGLQRGFKKAGANTIMMSLWKVDDNATQMLMTRFYDNLFLRKDPKTGKNFTKAEALKEAQAYVREFEKEIVIEDNTPTGVELIKEMQHDKKQEISKKTVVKPYNDPKYWAAFILLDALD